MLLRRCKRLIHSIKTIGFKDTCRIVIHRAKKELFIARMRSKALQHREHHNWNDLSKKYKKSWSSFLNDCKAQLLSDIAPFLSASQHILRAEAQKYAKHEFQALGSSWYALDDDMWHIDIRLKEQNGQNYLFDKTSFYADISIESGASEALVKDIKVPWELSRLQHLPLLAHAYQVDRNEIYKNAFIYHVRHWQQHNSYLLGINWLCPMEVALRAISLIIAFDVFKASDISNEFWQSYTSLLYDHMLYLEHNWEWYDGKTSNHYLSDLVGYLYLCYFFKPLYDISKKTDWVIKEILREFDKQVFEEGTSYEGSTHYHKLITELFYHVQQLSASMNVTLPTSFHQRLAFMFEFIDWCSVNDQHMIAIGDNDSGKVTYAGLPHIQQQSSSEYVKQYNQFGLSIFKDKRWHITLRHHAYDEKQPSGHHHDDIGSVTLAIDGISVLIDPGTFVYTASSVQRNRFRSHEMHNVMRLADKELINKDEHLFYLNIPARTVLNIDNNKNELKTTHELYKSLGLSYERKVRVNDEVCIITDAWTQVGALVEDQFIYFNLTFAPLIRLKKDERCWRGFYEDKQLFTFFSSFDIKLQAGCYSSSYGISEKTSRLVAQVPLQINNRYESLFTLI